MIKSAEKYHSMRFWDELFKSKGFKSLGYGPNEMYSGYAHRYQVPSMTGQFFVLMDDWFFRGSNKPQFTVAWCEGKSITKFVWTFSYPEVWEFRLFLSALQDPRLMLACAEMNWCSRVVNRLVTEPEIIPA
jgi:hypothetical protein